MPIEFAPVSLSFQAARELATVPAGDKVVDDGAFLKSAPKAASQSASALTSEIAQSARGSLGADEIYGAHDAPLVTISWAVEQAEHDRAVSPGHRRSDLQEAMQLVNRVDRTPAGRRLLARLFFQMARHGDVGPRAQARLYHDAATEAALGGGDDVAAAAHRAILGFSMNPASKIEPPRASMFGALKHAYKADDGGVSRSHARVVLGALAERFGTDRAVQTNIQHALDFDAELDSAPAAKLRELASAGSVSYAGARSESTVLSTSPLKATAIAFVPRRTAHMLNFHDSAESSTSKAPIASLPSEDEFLHALTRS